MKKYKNYTLSEYMEVLSSRTPVPGGGSAAAYTGALGAALISMVANYSIGKGDSLKHEKEIRKIIKESFKIQKALLDYVDLDAEAYKKVIKSKQSTKERTIAERKARKVPKEVCRFCYRAITLTPFLVKKGNVNLMSDIEVAVEMLFAAYNSALMLSKL